MQSSLSCSHHGRIGFSFQQNTNPAWAYPQRRVQSPLFLILRSTRPYTSPASSSVQLALRSPHFQSQPPPPNKPTWTPSTAFIPHPEVIDGPASRFPPLRCGVSSNSYSTNGARSFRDWIELIGEAVSTAFPIWVALGCLLGLIKPSSFNWVQPKWTIVGITLTMLGMGMTLTLDDLRGALAMPKQLLSGFLLQYSVMPLSGFLVSKLLNLPPYYAAGLILVGCCPGGTASNIVTYIARGNVALSVLMTAASTLAAVFMTPFLTAKLAGQYVAVDAIGLLLSTLQVVLLPVLAGAFLNQYFQGLVKFISPVMPPIAVATVAVLCGNAIAQSASAILMSGRQVVLAASLLHASGFFFGYILSRMLGIDVSSSRTISIEVGMQNSVLGVVLASQHFGNPLTAVPCAVSSVCHSIFGSVLAGIWRRMPAQKQD
ncbi:probable sodium/metabolite cotransporter BASS1, chloroplastic [Corylus avellana]|uniref:probable sodium/metabolite cotransporter BASS1, chloroplastic n=1 Tax=Corylus avellana TaxID=13451 RepID=UPI00286BFB20|nr:probable sodium/metabolite cotransporter BASS1, chloroplastic [Corylus avellana]XP_059441291.1 probable sodium/metabolite cotransporter BASS1, chloroplastic [Corylus avellana]XP_059441292.1 probable sodium/metabolite cotransporter BASS1, chloroplastic [Corylus avellana]